MTRYLKIARRNVSRNRRRSAITLCSILAGVAGVILLKGFLVGFGDMLEADVVEGRIGALLVQKAGAKGGADANPANFNFEDTEALATRILKVDGVKAVTPRLYFRGFVSNGLSQAMFVGRGIAPDRERIVCPRFGEDVNRGTSLLPGDTRFAVVGHELAQGMKLEPRPREGAAPNTAMHDTITLSSTSPGGRANALDAVLVGTSKSGMEFENKRVLTVPLSFAQALLGLQGHITEYAVAVHDVKRLEDVAAILRSELGAEYQVKTWRDAQPFLNDIIQQQQVALGVISFVLFIIVLTIIVNTMLMSIFERVREIGTMLAFGVRRAHVLRLFLLEALMIGVLGGLGGAIAGLAAVAGFAFFGIRLAVLSAPTLLRPSVPLSFVLSAVGFATAGAVLAAAYPAWRASRQSPADALRTL